jgi:peroxiredoxin Q/BCP
VIIGISVDTLALQQKFTEKEKLPFPLLADDEQKFAKVYGVLNPKNKLASRATFVIAKDGNISKIYNPVGDAKGHPEQVLEYVKTTFKK